MSSSRGVKCRLRMVHTMESHAADLSDALARLRLGTTSVNPRFSKNST